jgi:hypothetical protein
MIVEVLLVGNETALLEYGHADKKNTLRTTNLDHIGELTEDNAKKVVNESLSRLKQKITNLEKARNFLYKGWN